MNNDREITFSLLKKFPEEFTMDRLARYLRVVGELVGSNGQVRVKGISRGSVKVKLVASTVYYPEMVARVASSGRSDAPLSLRRARRALEQLVSEDRVDAKLVVPGGHRLLYLRGYRPDAGMQSGPIKQPFTVRGRLIGLEGKDETKHARIAEYAVARELSGEIRDDSLTRQLKEWLFTPVVIEFSGNATLRRGEQGDWEVDGFRIESAEQLEPGSAKDVLKLLGSALERANVKATDIGDSVYLRR